MSPKSQSLTGKTLNKKWTIGKLLGSGACCSGVYDCTAYTPDTPCPALLTRKTSTQSKNWVCKVAPVGKGKGRGKKTKVQRNADTLFYEHTLYNHHLLSLRDGRMIPEVPRSGRGYGVCEAEGVVYFVMEKFDKTWFEESTGGEDGRIGGRVVKILEELHKKSIVFADIKPENVMLTNTMQGVHLIDFGLAAMYHEVSTRSHRPDECAPGNIHSGTPQYCSLGVHRGHTPARRDDVEGVGFCVWEKLLGGASLPWGNCTSHVDGLQKKEKAVADLIAGDGVVVSTIGRTISSQGLKNFFSSIRSCEYDEKPDYSYLVSCLESIDIVDRL